MNRMRGLWLIFSLALSLLPKSVHSEIVQPVPLFIPPEISTVTTPVFLPLAPVLLPPPIPLAPVLLPTPMSTPILPITETAAFYFSDTTRDCYIHQDLVCPPGGTSFIPDLLSSPTLMMSINSPDQIYCGVKLMLTDPVAGVYGYNYPESPNLETILTLFEGIIPPAPFSSSNTLTAACSAMSGQTVQIFGNWYCKITSDSPNDESLADCQSVVDTVLGGTIYNSNESDDGSEEGNDSSDYGPSLFSEPDDD